MRLRPKVLKHTLQSEKIQLQRILKNQGREGYQDTSKDPNGRKQSHETEGMDRTVKWVTKRRRLSM